jgi:hypothetical protein
MFTIENIKRVAIEIEKHYASYIGHEVEEMRKNGGDKLANEMLASVACLFMARATAIIHVWTGESVESIRKRLIETYDDDLKSTVQKIIKTLAEPSAGG